MLGPPERYHLFTSALCPLAHLSSLARAVGQLEARLGCNVAEKMDARGWIFSHVGFAPFAAVGGKTHLCDVYAAAEEAAAAAAGGGGGGGVKKGVKASSSSPSKGGGGGGKGRNALPLLWDKEERRVVSCDPMEVMRHVHSFIGSAPPEAQPSSDGAGQEQEQEQPKQQEEGGEDNTPRGLRPAALRAQVDAMNARLADEVSDQISRVGHSPDGASGARVKARRKLYAALKALDGELANRRFLLGDALTEPDLLLFALLARFDVGYRGAFHCAPGRFICGDEPRGFPHLQHFAREVYQIAGVAPTCEFGVYLTFYAMLPMTLSKLGCVPGSLLTLLGVRRELSLPHERGPRQQQQQQQQQQQGKGGLYGPYSQPGVHAIVSKVSLLLNSVAIIFALAYLLDKPLFNKLIDTAVHAVSFNKIQYPDDWG